MNMKNIYKFYFASHQPNRNCIRQTKEKGKKSGNRNNQIFTSIKDTFSHKILFFNFFNLFEFSFRIFQAIKIAYACRLERNKNRKIKVIKMQNNCKHK